MQPQSTVPTTPLGARRAINPDVVSTYSLRVEALSTIIIIAALLFGFAAATPPSSTPPGSTASFAVSLLISLTLSFSSFALAVSSAIVYQMLNLTSDVALAAIDASAGTSEDAAIVTSRRRVIDGSLREIIDDYVVGSHSCNMYSRAALLGAFVSFLIAAGVERVYTLESFGQLWVVFALGAGACAIGVALSALRRRSARCYQQLHRVCEEAGVGAQLATLALASPRSSGSPPGYTRGGQSNAASAAPVVEQNRPGRSKMH
jgi:hypothetical protein